MTCDRSTVRCAKATNYQMLTPDCCRQHVREVSFYIFGLLERIGATYWADYGTLLGAVRNPLTRLADYPWLQTGARDRDEPLAPGILPHDKDADIGVLAEHKDDVLALREEIETAGYWTHYRPAGGGLYGGGDRLKVCVSKANHANIDVFFWYSGADGMRYRKAYIHVDRYKGREFPEAKLLPLKLAEWEGRPVPVPGETEWFLEHRYGKKWRTPVAANHDGRRRAQ